MMNMENTGYPMEELFAIVLEMAAKYCGCDHSSITYEKAQTFMEAVLYCINEYQGDGQHALLKKDIAAKEAYELGREIVKDKLRSLHSLYNGLVLDFQDYGFICLKDTITKEIPAFLSNYDVQYAPQETQQTFGYPILRDLSDLSGVDFVLEYTKCINFEQQLFGDMDAEYVMQMLRIYYRDYEELAVNICEIVLQNTVGHMMLNKPLSDRGFSEEEIGGLEAILSEKTQVELEGYITEAFRQMVANYFDQDGLLLDYLFCGVPNIVARMQSNLHGHCLENVFLL